MKTYHKITVMLGAALMLCSCADYLIREPQDALDPATFFSSQENAVIAVNGIYNAALEPVKGRTYAIDFDCMTDNMYNYSRNQNTQEFGQGTQGASSVYALNMWSRGYRGISRANTLLAWLDNCYKLTQPANNIKDRLRSEALFLRAYFYAELTDLFGDVPMYLEQVDLADSKPRTPKAQVVEQILGDLTEAAKYLPVTYAAEDTGRATRGAALASCAGETAERPGASAPDGNSGDTGGGTTIDLTGYRLIFADEFDGRRMNWDLWAADDPNNIKNETSRGPEAVEVRDGELRLNVRRVNRSEKVKWIAGYVYLKEPLENNVYIECRFRSGQCSGVNNAFWLACKTPPNTTWCNKYEVDIVEARKDVRTGLGNGHLAYHDWKTYPYALDKNGNKCDIAAGISVKHSFEDYHIWGLWYGENEMIYYLDGQEMWRRKTSTSYPDQYYTGVGKAPVWNPLEEQRAYGRYGQEDWNYQAGYNGDRMHVILANIPWGSTWSPLVEEEADGTWMAVDYVRIYKPESLLDPTPETDLPHPAAEVELDRTYSLAEEGCSYFSTEITRKAGEELTLTFVEADGSAVGKVIVDTEGSLLTGITRLTSSLVAASPVQGTQIVPENRKMLLVCRITAKAGHEKYDKDAISVWCVPVDEAREAREPYFYPNIDENGNTSATQGWHINQKGFSDEVISRVLFTSTTGDLSSFGRFRAGRNFVCVTR